MRVRVFCVQPESIAAVWVMDDPTQGCADEKIDCNHTTSPKESIQQQQHTFSSRGIRSSFRGCNYPDVMLPALRACQIANLLPSQAGETQKITPAAAATARTFCLEASEIFMEATRDTPQ
jgi:hypothetical protein